jgi:Fic family protein
MHSFKPDFLDRLSVSQTMLQSVRHLGEFKGKEALYRKQSPAQLETLRQTAMIQSTESSNRIEGITAPLPRIKSLIAKRTKPKNRSEQEIAGYRDALNLVHARHAGMQVTPGLVLQLHKEIYKYLPNPGGRFKMSDNDITESIDGGLTFVRFKPLPAHLTESAMESLHSDFRRQWDLERVDRLVLIPAYVFDFLCIHPFSDGNGRISRLLTLLLLYRAGYGVGRYISLERVVEESSEAYYDALLSSSKGWHEGRHDLRPWVEYFHGTLLSAYKQFESQAEHLVAGKGEKSKRILEAIENFPGDFTIEDLQRASPRASLDLIRAVLKKESAAGRVKCLKRGPKAPYRKIR